MARQKEIGAAMAAKSRLEKDLRTAQKQLAYAMILSIHHMRRDNALKLGSFPWSNRMGFNSATQIATYTPIFVRCHREHPGRLFAMLTNMASIGFSKYNSAQKQTQALYNELMTCCPTNTLPSLRSNTKQIPFDAIKINMASVDGLLRELAKTDGMHSEEQRFQWAQRVTPQKVSLADAALTEATHRIDQLLTAVNPTQSS